MINVTPLFFGGGLKLNSIAKLLLEVYAWPKLNKMLCKMSLGSVLAANLDCPLYSLHSHQHGYQYIYLYSVVSTTHHSQHTKLFKTL